ncbi:hypothetical protein AJ80_01597 [Polytolypa hystricis UAMH7299]|uniref:Uncharacterized protein n=1 Tax=Polytolypa hystricis (strain UAMH7299) TaxID=1447883 RepID=A0A2B7Z010_POLH7|nr:hypothetical protein AJ80_01597 [Polytolypa hystricis UAMH7299]
MQLSYDAAVRAGWRKCCIYGRMHDASSSLELWLIQTEVYSLPFGFKPSSLTACRVYSFNEGSRRELAKTIRMLTTPHPWMDPITAVFEEPIGYVNMRIAII